MPKERNFVDSCIFVAKYLTEPFAESCADFLADSGNGYIGVISPIVVGEVTNKILEHTRDETHFNFAMSAFRRDLKRFEREPIYPEIVDIYQSMKEGGIWHISTHDKLMLASALHLNCSGFVVLPGTKEFVEKSQQDAIVEFARKIRGSALHVIPLNELRDHKYVK